MEEQQNHAPSSVERSGRTKKIGLKTIFMILIVILIGVYFFLKSDCIKNINFMPGMEKPMGRGSILKTESRYEFWPDDYFSPKVFQTRKEAISYCISEKI